MKHVAEGHVHSAPQGHPGGPEAGEQAEGVTLGCSETCSGS
jgi:hypothetical protein